MRILPSVFEHLTSFCVFEVLFFFIIILMERLEQKGEESTHLFFLAQSEKIVAFKRPKLGNLERVEKKT